MAWGEVHCLTGITIQRATCGDDPSLLLLPAVALSVLSHWPLDDLNVGEVAKIYHGTGKQWRNVATTIARIPIIAAICYILFCDPIYMLCGIPAWLALDHEWALCVIGKHGYGLHSNMWPSWLYGEKGLFVWFFVMILMVIILV